MEKRKKLTTILSAAIIVTAIFAPLLFVKTVVAADPTNWYMTVNGVLDSDTYMLYPYASESLKVGFSKFGELIDSNTNVGLEYAGDRDPFAPIAGSTVDTQYLPKNVWINGWFIDIRYNHSSWGFRNVWAGALFADLSDYGRPWLRVDNGYGSCTYEWQEAFNLPGRELNAAGDPVGTTLYNGGRKTNGTVITDDITVLYNGPRLFVAKIVNHVYDWYEPTNIKLHIVDVVLTIMFNKVKKEVVVLKDVKFIPQAKFQLANLIINVGEASISVPYGVLVQFSNREEWDLGLEETGTTKYSSYVHFYTADGGEAEDTVYNDDWTILPTLPANTAVKGVTVNKYGSEPKASGTYDVAQIIANDEAYVGWHAFWPSLSDYSADAGRRGLWYRAILAADPHDKDSSAVPNDEPFRSPLIVGEWDFLLSDQSRSLGSGVKADVQFRGVSVYGVTDLHDGDDAHMDNGHNDALDTEVLYQLNEVFNPWDLLSAVHKDTKRWVEWKAATSSTTFTTSHAPVVYVDDDVWDDYCVFSERVIDLTENELEARVGYNWMGQDTYTVTYNADGTMTISGLDAYHAYKILYSTDTDWSSNETITFEFFANSNTLNDSDFESWTDPLGVTHTAGIDDIDISASTQATEDFEENFTFTLYGWERDFKVFKGSTYTGSWDYYEPMVQEGTYATVSLDFLDIHWIITAPSTEDVHIWELGFKATVEITISYNGTNMNITATVTLAPPVEYAGMDVLYSESVPGRYEWGIVGRDAHSVDSAGLSMVSAAFKNKQVEYGLAGADMYDPLPYNQMPYVMHKFGTGNTWENYYYSGTDYRTALRDDWCKAGTLSGDEVPVASSNMIGVGGPLANLLAYYGNDFTQAIYGLSDGTKYGDFTNYAAWENVIIPLTCWDITKTRTYSSTNTTGYAVISTYKDINGTVLFLVWGHWGRDTYYASKWFHEEGIFQLQDAPEGLTAIILKITYESTVEGYKPKAYSIVECLGTISETEWTHGSIIKGGIHDP
ncbi:MAG: hypothetical protein QW146_02510 [Candidatus Bathyarchaeia archaeon]